MGLRQVSCARKARRTHPSAGPPAGGEKRYPGGTPSLDANLSEQWVCDGFLAHLKREDHDLTADQVPPFGDWLNDRPLMRAAGFGVAMQNAVPSVKALANHTLPHTCDEVGIARFIETHLL